tara:strand:+ start:2041 stop:3105 length:1065 start_codon:yes stop_codon:yes gene_type:complete
LEDYEALRQFATDREHEHLNAIRNGGSVAAAARELGISERRIYTALSRLRARAAKAPQTAPVEFEVELPPDELAPVYELIERRKKAFARKHAAEVARKLIPVKVRIDGPIGICHGGDPHLDDNGTDIALVERHLGTIEKTAGLFGANVGDLQNNWIGRLARLWSEQGTSAQESWQLVEWYLTSLNPLYLVGGNHDAWTGSGDPIKWMMRSQVGIYEAHGVRLNLVFPNKKEVRINARHDFSGHSMWNPNHGPMKAVQMGWRDHILTCGHKHEAFVTGPMKAPSDGLLSWAVRCGTYKVHDRYGKEKGLPDQIPFSACVTIIDPQYADNDTRLITVIPDVEEAAEFLTWKRGRNA